MLPKVRSMFGFWKSMPGRKFFLAGWTRYGVSMICKHTRTHTWTARVIFLNTKPQCCPLCNTAHYTQGEVDEWQCETGTLNSCRLARGSHSSFSVLPPTTNKVATMAISAQEKMKEKPTPLVGEDRMGTWLHTTAPNTNPIRQKPSTKSFHMQNKLELRPHPLYHRCQTLARRPNLGRSLIIYGPQGNTKSLLELVIKQLMYL